MEKTNMAMAMEGDKPSLNKLQWQKSNLHVATLTQVSFKPHILMGEERMQRVSNV